MIGRFIVTVSVTLGWMSLCGAQEAEPPAPWKRLDGRNAGAVGTCSLDDAADRTTCYLVRCEKGRDLLFVVQEDDLADFGVRKLRFEIGRYKQTVNLAPARGGEQTISLSKHPKLLAALTSGKSWAGLQAVEAKIEYGTGFELTNAAPLIAQVSKTCQP